MNMNRYDFLVFLRMLLIWIGSISLMLALLFFTAYNWNELGRFFKFLIIEAIMVSTVLLYLFSDKYKIAQKVLLTSSSVTLGILLALIGQTYQTGADPWQLFAIWALLITPWVFSANFSGLWILWILLLNISSILYYQKLHLNIFMLLATKESSLLILFALNTLLWIAWSFLTKFYLSFKKTLIIRILSFFSFSSLTFLVITNLYNNEWSYVALYAIILGIIYYIYRIKKLDIYIMSLYSLSLFLFIFNLSFKIIIMAKLSKSILMFFFMTIVTMISTMATTTWIKKLKKEFE